MTRSIPGAARHWLNVARTWPLLSLGCLAPSACGDATEKNAAESGDLGKACGEEEVVVAGVVELDAETAECQGVCLRGEAVAQPGMRSTGRCSCHCDGPAGTGPFCACGAGYACQHEVDDLGLAERDLAGSYCVALP